MVPAMDGGMWDHAAVGANVATLRGRGVTVLEPDTGALASGLRGKGRFPEIEDIVEALQRALIVNRDLAGERLIVTGRADARGDRSGAVHLETARPARWATGSPPPRSGAERPSR